MKKLFYFLPIILLSSCSTVEEDYYEKITNLANGEYSGFSYTKMKYIGMPHPKANAIIYLDGKNLSKDYEYYEPLTAETGVVFGWDGPHTMKENGTVKSQNIIWSTKNNRLVIVGDWLETSLGGTATFNISPILSGDNAGEIYASMFTDYWEVWGYKEIDKENFNTIVELCREYYKKTHNDEEPWK